ncbi:hypothetical protein [Streptomyces avermitilis]|uniref:hypothetical protein n=1 Tax=Streptomyces avermitilis TaxID=33903 RepID=UPI0033D74019
MDVGLDENVVGSRRVAFTEGFVVGLPTRRPGLERLTMPSRTRSAPHQPRPTASDDQATLLGKRNRTPTGPPSPCPGAADGAALGPPADW